jgi:hypothetical protein
VTTTVTSPDGRTVVRTEVGIDDDGNQVVATTSHFFDAYERRCAERFSVTALPDSFRTERSQEVGGQPVGNPVVRHHSRSRELHFTSQLRGDHQVG